MRVRWKDSEKELQSARESLNALWFAVALIATLCKLPTEGFAIYGHGCEEDCIALFEFKASRSR